MQIILGILLGVGFLVVTTLPSLGVLALASLAVKRFVDVPVFRLYFISVAVVVVLGFLANAKFEGGTLTAAFLLFIVTPVISLIVLAVYIAYIKLISRNTQKTT